MGLTLLLVGAPVSASPADLFGVGLRSQAMAQTGAAYGEHDHQSFTNPALLGGVAQQHLSLGYQSALFVTRYRSDSGAEAQSQELASATTLGVTLPLPFGGFLRDRLAIGFSAYSPRKLVTRAQLWYPDRPQFPLLASRAQSLSLATALGAKVLPRLNLGVGLRWLASLAGSVSVTGSESGETTTVVQDKLVTSLAPVAGLRAEPFDNVFLGLVWRDEHTSRIDVAIQVAELGALELPELNIAGMAQYDPEQVDAELAWLIGAWQLAGAVRYRRWSAFPGFLEQTFDCPESEPICGAKAPAPPNFSDTWALRAGVAKVSVLAPAASSELRLGLGYEPTPVPEQTGTANRWDNSRVVASAGYGVKVVWGGVPLAFELALQQQWLVERTHVKSAMAAETQPELARVTTAGSVRLVAFGAGVTF